MQLREVYDKLNDAQREAVDTIYGPVLVIAGPGTGKTQLLSARVANILQKTDATPSNILCLTFTENGALNMRERLTSFIGSAAYDVTISTYHGFGSSIIGRFPQYFSDLRLERPVDELGKHRIVKNIVDDLDYNSPLRFLRYRLGDLIGTISELKRGLITPDILTALADDNIRTIAASSEALADAMQFAVPRMPSKLEKAEPGFQEVLNILQRTNSGRVVTRLPSLAEQAAAALETALTTAQEAGKTTALRQWKDDWLEKDTSGNFRLRGSIESVRARATATVLSAYDAQLKKDGLYDFDDMILQAIDVLASNDDLRFTLQEQYQFILLDEFQDTNAAQLRLVELLTDNPVHEAKPNVLAVGDDDQAIYAFQGAEVSNMLDFSRMYREVKVMTLTENYRSVAPVLETASGIAEQISSRLHHHFAGITKQLVAKNTNLPTPEIRRISYASDVAERAGITNEVKRLIADGISPGEIAILSPKHKYLTSLVPYLQAEAVPVAYEKRENILTQPRVVELLTMARLVMALKDRQYTLANSLWPSVLSFDFWDFSVSDIWRLSWQVSDDHSDWAKHMLDSDQFRHAALLFLTLAGKVETESAEVLLDALIGTMPVTTNDRTLPSVRSPFRDYYFKTAGERSLYETTTALSILRDKFMTYETRETGQVLLPALLDFAALYESVGQQMINTSPYHQAADAVQLMTVYKAKGLEFAHVFLLDVQDNVWGKSARSNSNTLTLPKNLESIRHAGSSDDEKLRDLYVAVTRAKHGLHLMSYEADYAGKRPEHLKYLGEVMTGDILQSTMLPEPYRTVQHDSSAAMPLKTLELHWTRRHLTPDAPLKALLKERLAQYQLSPTHLTKFINLVHGGPDSFLVDVLLRFPGATTPEATFGNVMHSSLQFVQDMTNQHGEAPSASAVVVHGLEYIGKTSLPTEQKKLLSKRFADTIEYYLQQKRSLFTPGNVAEKNFRSEGVLIGGTVHMAGKIDLLEIDEESKTIVVVDYKTGKPHDSWKGSDVSLYMYRLQLICYKLLVEHSRTYRGYTVTAGRLDFTQPDSEDRFVSLSLDFTDKEVAETIELLTVVWHKITNLELPDVTDYGDNLSAVKQFVADLKN